MTTSLIVFILASPETSIKSDPTSKEDQSATICQVMFPPDYIEIHASACGERFVLEHKEFAIIQLIFISVISKVAVFMLVYILHLDIYLFIIVLLLAVVA